MDAPEEHDHGAKRRAPQPNYVMQWLGASLPSPFRSRGAGALFDALYAELHRMARRQLAREYNPLELDTTSLLHETYLAMSNREPASFPDRARFMAYAGRVMRHIIIDDVRRRGARKRGAWNISPLEQDCLASVGELDELTRLRDALDALADVEALLAEIVDLKFFCGLSFAEIAASLAISERTAQRKWEKARLYLFQALRAD